VDANSDGILSFDEFRSLILVLRNPNLAQHTSELLFALFDLDGSNAIDLFEWREMMRFVMGRAPSETEVRESWAKIADPGEEVVSKKKYIRWLRKSTDPKINVFAPPVNEEDSDDDDEGFDGANPFGSSASGFSGSHRASGAPGQSSYSMKDRPKWNSRFNAGLTLKHQNEVTYRYRREYFMREHSLPELRRFYKTFNGFDRHLDKMAAPPPPRPTSAMWPKSLSSEGGTPLLQPGRHSPAGTMLGHPNSSTDGFVTLWEEHWQTPKRLSEHGRPYHNPLAPRATFPALTDAGTFMKKHKRPSRRRATSEGFGSRSPSATRLGQGGRPTTFDPEPW
jgi:hypothetical protein